MNPEQMRRELKAYQRRFLQNNLSFIDDNEQRKLQIEAAFRGIRGMWEAEAAIPELQPVISSALEASTTDNEQQTIDNVLDNNRSFWSSTGSSSQLADESLLFELKGPAAQVAFVQVAVYRAFYQQGYPVYPPMQLQVWLGPSPQQLQAASPIMQVQATDALQTFALDQHAPVGRFMQLRLYGKLQKQREDMQFYTALRHVAARGRTLPPAQLCALPALLRLGSGSSGAAAGGSAGFSSGLRLNPGGQLPGSCCLQGALEAAAELEVPLGRALQGIAAAAAAAAAGSEGHGLQTSAAGSSFAHQQQQQQLEVAVYGQLVVHPQQQQQQRPSGKRRSQRRRQQQQQQQEPGVRGVWAAFSSFRRRIRAAGAGSSDGDSSQEAAPVSPTGAVPAGSSSSSRPGKSHALAEASAVTAVAVPRDVTPRWLQSEQQQQQQQQQWMAIDDTLSGYCSSSSSSEDEAGRGNRRRSAAAAAAAAAGRPGGAAAEGFHHAHLELMLWQAVQGLGAAGQEEELLALLEDEPLAAAAAAGPSSTAWQQQQQQQQQCPPCGSTVVAGLRPVLRPNCQGGSSSSGGSSTWACPWQQQQQQDAVVCTADVTRAQLVLQVRAGPSQPRAVAAAPLAAAAAAAVVVLALPGRELFVPPVAWQQCQPCCCSSSCWFDETDPFLES